MISVWILTQGPSFSDFHKLQSLREDCQYRETPRWSYWSASLAWCHHPCGQELGIACKVKEMLTITASFRVRLTFTWDTRGETFFRRSSRFDYHRSRIGHSRHVPCAISRNLLLVRYGLVQAWFGLVTILYRCSWKKICVRSHLSKCKGWGRACSFTETTHFDCNHR